MKPALPGTTTRRQLSAESGPATVSLPERFIQERICFKAVSPRTVEWYHQAFAAFGGALEDKTTIGQRIGELRERGLSTISCNTYLRVINAYFRWAYTDGHRPDLIHVPRLLEQQKVIGTLKPDQVHRIIAYRPRGKYQHRTHALMLLLLDTGMRISEALSLRRSDIDFDNLLCRVSHAKGGKHRVVPLSMEVRKVLWRWIRSHENELVFPSRRGTMLKRRNTLREFKQFAVRLGIEGVRFSPHTMRHTFSVFYLRKGGNLFYLSKILGHTSVKTTERYLQNVQTEDLQAVHSKLSLLSGVGR